jgi:maltooligosyltrehalose trehalohydrolase
MTLTMLAPQTPMLFMGQEFSASTPFIFFADHEAALGRKVHAGRREFLRQFRAYVDPRAQERVPAPDDAGAFAASHLDWSEADSHAGALLFHRELIALRRNDPVISRQQVARLDGATLSEHAFALRWSGDEHGDRLLVINLHQELPSIVASEPLLAPPRDGCWVVEWSSEDPRYGGHGVAPPVVDGGRGPWRLQANCAVLLTARSSTR